MFLSVASKSAGIAILLRIVLSIFDITDVSDPSWHSVLNWPDISLSIAILSVFSMFVGNILAIKQTSLKRMLAYSSIAQAGYILIGFVAILSSTQINDAVFNASVMVAYVFGYMFTNLAAFYSMGAIKQNIDSFIIGINILLEIKPGELLHTTGFFSIFFATLITKFKVSASVF